MATARKVQLDPSLKPVYSTGSLTPESAQRTSELLQKNHDENHIFFNKSGFHNHIVHHLLTVYALGSPADQIQRSYNRNQIYQVPVGKFNETQVQAMLDDTTAFSSYLGVNDHYTDFLEFFHRELEAKGATMVLTEYLWSGTPKADDMLVRLYAGFMHPIIHLGFGLEFAQPAIVAEALALAAVNETWMAPLLLGAEKAAKQHGQPDKTLESIRLDMLANSKLKQSAHWADGNKIRDGILQRAPGEMVAFAAQYIVPNTASLPLKTAEMMNFTAYFTAAAQNPPHEPKIDFFYMHSINCAVFFPALMAMESIPDAAKIRLLEWKVRTDLALYGSRGFPELKIEEVEGFVPSAGRSVGEGWAEWIDAINRLPSDDGHAAKLIRAIAATKQTFAKGNPAEGKTQSEGFYLGEEALDKMAQMVVYSVNLPGKKWVRNAGFQEAWEGMPVKKA